MGDLIKKLFKMLTDKEFILQVIKFGIIGVTTSVLDWCILALFVRVFHVDSMVGNVFSFILSTIYSFWANSKFVFDFDKSKGRKRLFISFFLLACVGLLINEATMLVGDKILHFDPLIVKVAGILLAAIFNFITRKLLLEKKKAPDEGTEA